MKTQNLLEYIKHKWGEESDNYTNAFKKYNDLNKNSDDK